MFFDTNSIYPLILLVLDPSTHQQAREYDDYLRGKVEAGRTSMRAGHGRSNG